MGKVEALEKMRDSARQIIASASDLQLSIIGCVALPVGKRNELGDFVHVVLAHARDLAFMPIGKEIVLDYKAQMFDALEAMSLLLDSWKKDDDENNDNGLIELAFAAESAAKMIREYLNAKKTVGALNEDVENPAA